MNYDNWLVYEEMRYRNWDEPDNTCQHCGEPSEQTYCSTDCFNADML